MAIENMMRATDDNTREIERLQWVQNDGIEIIEVCLTDYITQRDESWKWRFDKVLGVCLALIEENANLLQGIRNRQSQNGVPQLLPNKTGCRDMPWSLIEDMKLRIHTQLHSDWNRASECLDRTPQQCQQRYEVLAAIPSKKDPAACVLAHTYERQVCFHRIVV